MGFRIALIIFLAPWFSNGCLDVKDAAIENRVNHVVLCWLKEPGNIEQRKKIIEASRSFNDIPGVLEIRTGTAIQSDRDAVDDSFDVGICVTFGTLEDLERYTTHPKHTAAVRNVLLPFVDRIVVYDFIESDE